MKPQFVEYYNRELAYLRELGAEFAAAFPKVAGRLAMRDTDVADPYVERLLEGFAFLTARIQLKMDAEFPRLSQRILEMVCPHYLAPTPAMLVAQVEPSATEGSLAAGFSLPAGTVLRSRKLADEQTPCEFRTGQELMLWPLEMLRARLAGAPVELPATALRLPVPAAGHLRLDLGTRSGLSFDQLALDRLELYLAGPDSVATQLQELVHGGLLGVVVHDAQDPARIHAQLGPEALQPEGFEQAQALLPYTQRAFQGHRLLHEYFAFPARFRFLSIQGLAPALQRCKGRQIAITLLLRRPRPELEAMVDAQNVLLHCVPAINLLQRNADRIHLSPGVHEYHVVPDRTRPRDHEVYSVRTVSGHYEGRTEEREFVPLYAAMHGLRAEDQAYFTVRRERRLFSEHALRFGPRTRYLGSEVFLALVDQRDAPFSDELRQLGVVVLCTNRDLPLLMPVGHPGGDLTPVESAPVGAIRVVAGPSQPTEAIAESEITWRLISHLTLNYLALSDRSEEEGAATLRELLGLYRDLGQRELGGQVQGVASLAIEPITRRLPQHRQLVYGRGVGLRLLVDDAPFAGVSPWPLAAVLEQFFSRHVGINGFTELELHSRQRGRLASWPARMGRRPAA
ncbi:MAG TPA: type VI secretion system baseplate subunit TssF [Rubrivivax sp.]|nr:type VI secretion system baseplate subunit TssF [Burkholderiales bacterium]HNT39595.1 type VI secretion system baseplate subunit TssF [Rubrivivax sp.]